MTTSSAKTTKQKVDMGLQAFLGLFLLIFGINKFAHFMPNPEMPEAAGQLMGAFAQSGYILPMVALTEILVGILLLIRQWSALALLLLAPLSVNILLFHLVLAPSAILMGLVVAVLNVYLLFAYKPKYDPVLAAK